MEIEELLKPRYKVIADYPNQSTAKGNIVNDRVNEHFHITTIQYFDEFGTLVKEANWVTQDEMEKYPAILRKLEWWEEREIKDLPEYIRLEGHNICKLKYCTGKQASLYEHYMPCGFSEGMDNRLISLRMQNSYPATKEEYEQQLKKEIACPKNK